MTRFEFDTMINYNLFQKFKLLDNCEFDHLTIILTNLGGLQFEPYSRNWLNKRSPSLSYIHLQPPYCGETLLLMQLGFDSLFFARIDYQDRAKRKNEKSLEVIWRGSKSFGSSAQVSLVCLFVFFFFSFNVQTMFWSWMERDLNSLCFQHSVDFCWCISRELWTSQWFLLWSEWWFPWFAYCSSESLVWSCWQAVDHCLRTNCIYIALLTCRITSIYLTIMFLSASMNL